MDPRFRGGDPGSVPHGLGSLALGGTLRQGDQRNQNENQCNSKRCVPPARPQSAGKVVESICVICAICGFVLAHPSPSLTGESAT